MPGNCGLIWNIDFPSLLSYILFLAMILNLSMLCVCCKGGLHYLRSQVWLHCSDNLIYKPFSSATLHKS